MATTKTFTLQQILAGFIANNNPSAVKQALINNSVILGSNPSKDQIANALYGYYLSKGNMAFLNLLKTIPVSANTSAKDKAILANTYQELNASYGGSSAPVKVSNARVGEASADKWWNDVIDVVLGHSQTVQPPIVTSETTTSPLVIGGLIAGVLLVLGLAYFFIGRRGV